MTLLVARATPEHAFVASDHRHAVEEDGEERFLDLGPKLYPVARGFGAAGCNGASGFLASVQAARLTRDFGGSGPGEVGTILHDTFQQHAPDVPDEDPDDQDPDEDPDDQDPDEDPARGLHVLALEREEGGFGAMALNTDGRMLRAFTEGLFTAVSAGMKRRDGLGETWDRLESAWDDGEESETVAGDLTRLQRLLGEAVAEDVSPRLTVAGVRADGERFVREVKA